jgi:hypothetical protein
VTTVLRIGLLQLIPDVRGRFRALIDGRLRAAMKAPLRGVWAAVFVRAEIMPASSSGRLLRTPYGLVFLGASQARPQIRV